MPAIAGHLPVDIVKTFHSFLDFCYIVRRHVLDDDSLEEANKALEDFLTYREIFRASGVRKSFSLPRQHSMLHYYDLIKEFGAPNGLCSSITESKHIEAVKKPWRRSNKFQALKQMLLTNERLDKLQAARAYFQSEGMLRPIFKLGVRSEASSNSSQQSQESPDGPSDPDVLGIDEEDDGILEGPTVVDRVDLAITPRWSSNALFLYGLSCS